MKPGRVFHSCPITNPTSPVGSKIFYHHVFLRWTRKDRIYFRWALGFSKGISTLVINVIKKCNFLSPSQAMLIFDPQKRLSAKAALNHPYFDDFDKNSVPSRHGNAQANWFDHVYTPKRRSLNFSPLCFVISVVSSPFLLKVLDKLPA